jgi:Lamin Tail Domain
MKTLSDQRNSNSNRLFGITFFTVFAALAVFFQSVEIIYGQAACTQSQVVINEIYTEGGLAGASYKNDFVELYNTTGSACNLTNYSIQVATGNANNFPNVFAFPNGSVIPGAGFFLIQFGSGGANGANLPLADFAATTDLSSSGKVALVNNPASLTGNCASNLTNSMDFVGYGTTNCYLGTGAAMMNTVTHSIERTYNGANTRNNDVDFIQKPASPRNTLSPTAANVTIAGRVTVGGYALYGARVTMTDQNGEVVTVRTNGFGYFTFPNVRSGETYVVSVTSKVYIFAPQVVQVFDNVSDLNFEYYGEKAGF